MLGRLKMAAACCLLLAIGVALAACGSSSDDASPDGGTQAQTSSSQASGAPASGDPIKIGLICGCTGVQAASLALVDDVASVWERAVNDGGGIDGHPVEVIVKDDQSNPSKATVAARELVESDRVVAVVGTWTTTAAAYAPYLAEHDIPLIGGNQFNLAVESSPGFFPAGGNFAGQNYGVLKEAAEAGKSRLSLMYCAEFPACAAISRSLVSIADTIGDIEVAQSAPISATAPNYTPACLAAKQAEADSAFVVVDGSIFQRVLRDCAQQNVELGQFNLGDNVTTPLAADPNAEGMVLTHRNLPASDTSTPGGRYLNEMLDEYAPGIKERQEWHEGLSVVWAGLQLFRKAGDLARLTPTSTSEDVRRGLYEIEDETLDGLAPPLTFTRGRGTIVDCWFVSRVQDGRPTVSSTEPSCIPQDEADAVHRALLG